MQFAIVFFVKTRRFLNVLVHRIFWNGQAVVLFDPAFFVQGGRLKVYPNWLELGQLFQRFNFFLDEAAVGQCKNIQHGRSPSAPKNGGQVFEKAAMG